MPATPSPSEADAINHNTGKKNGKPKDRKPKSTFGQKMTYPVEVPSGAHITMLRPGLQGLVKAGIVESFDQLTTIVQGEVIPKAEGRPTVDVAAIGKSAAQDPEKIAKMLDMMDRVVMHVVVEPKLLPTPILTEEQKAEGLSVEDIRDVEAHYIDYVDETDKSFIMQAAMGGSTDLERFRQESAKAMGELHSLEAASDPAE